MKETCGLSGDTQFEIELKQRGVRKHEYLCFRGNGFTGLIWRTSSFLSLVLHLPCRLRESALDCQSPSDRLLFDPVLVYQYVPKELVRERLFLKLQCMDEVCR